MNTKGKGVQRRATIAGPPDGNREMRLTRIREEASGQEGAERRSSKGSMNSPSMREEPEEEGADGGQEFAPKRHVVSSIEPVRRMKSLTLTDGDSGIAGGGGGGDQSDGTFVTIGEEPVRNPAPAARAMGEAPLKERDSWSSVQKRIADSKARRLSKAEDVQPVIVNTLASGYTSTKAAGAVGGRRVSNATGGTGTGGTTASSARKRESLNEMAGLGSGGGGGHSSLRKHESLKK